MAGQAAATSRTASNGLPGLALLHVAEAHAMYRQARDCEDALAAAENHFGRINDQDSAAELFAPTDLPRMAGSCCLFLDDAATAARFLTETLHRIHGRTKGAAVAAANLALAHTQQGKIDDAVDRPSTSSTLPAAAADSPSPSPPAARSTPGATAPPSSTSTTGCSR